MGFKPRITIDRTPVPPPTLNVGGRPPGSKYGFRQLTPGESLTYRPEFGVDLARELENVRNACRRYRRILGHNFQAGRGDDVEGPFIRIWCIAPGRFTANQPNQTEGQ